MDWTFLRSRRSEAATGGARRQRELIRLSGARAVRLMDGSHAEIPEHAHDWPVLSLYVMGAYHNRSELGETRVGSPSAMLYAAREAHANVAGAHGLEQIDIELDPAWLKLGARDFGPVKVWIGGPVARAARTLAATWSRADAGEARLAGATAEFLRLALRADPVRRPVWLDAVEQRLAAPTPPPTAALARELDLNPAWLAQAYRAATGEGLAETLRRRRVELATSLLRGSDLPAAEIAATAGFCDQSHMIRSFRGLLGRTPALVRSEWRSTAVAEPGCPDGHVPKDRSERGPVSPGAARR